jgi:hypothetical protein
MDMYKNSSCYVSLPPLKNKAYHHKIVASTGLPPNRGYGRWINIGINVQLAYQLYKYWLENPDETWAKERAINMANLFAEVQNPDGSVPSLWDPENKKFINYQAKDTELGYIYTTDRQAFGAMNLYRMYLSRKENENVILGEWKESALKAMDYIAEKAISDGILGRSYDSKGNYNTVAAPNEALIALDYFYAETGNRKYDEAREILEKFTYDVFVFKNHWFDWATDWGGWVDYKEPPPWNTDALNSISFATYCVYRHMHTGDQKYIDWAKHVVSYNWLVNIPVQFPGFKHVTKGLTREQDHYLTYDHPFRCTLLMDCYPYLSLMTNDRFFMDFYKMLIQTQHAYQHPADKGFQAFNIGLWWEKTGGAEPRDEVGEEGENFIVEFASMYLESVTSPNAYKYAGGADWGVGLDYDLNFTPNSGKEGLYVAAASSKVENNSWDAKKNTLTVKLQNKTGMKGMLFVSSNSGESLEKNCQVKINGKIIDKNSLKYSSKNNMLQINYMHNQEILNLQVVKR